MRPRLLQSQHHRTPVKKLVISSAGQLPGRLGCPAVGCCRPTHTVHAQRTLVMPHMVLLGMVETSSPVDGNVIQPMVEFMGTFQGGPCIELAKPVAAAGDMHSSPEVSWLLASMLRSVPGTAVHGHHNNRSVLLCCMCVHNAKPMPGKSFHFKLT